MWCKEHKACERRSAAVSTCVEVALPLLGGGQAALRARARRQHACKVGREPAAPGQGIRQRKASGPAVRRAQRGAGRRQNRAGCELPPVVPLTPRTRPCDYSRSQLRQGTRARLAARQYRSPALAPSHARPVIPTATPARHETGPGDDQARSWQNKLDQPMVEAAQPAPQPATAQKGPADQGQPVAEPAAAADAPQRGSPATAAAPAAAPAAATGVPQQPAPAAKGAAAGDAADEGQQEAGRPKG